MVIVDCAQRSPEWFACRLGIPTASDFDKIVQGTGKQSTQRTKYMYKLAAEKVSGFCEDTYQSPAMIRGIEIEEEARNFYEFIRASTVDQVGFCISDDGLSGCSPDGLVGEDGLLEIKCPTPAVHVGYLLENTLPSEYLQQVQGQLLVTGRKWCDFLSYYPGLKPLLIRVERNEPFLKTLEFELKGFCQELQTVITRIS